MPPERSRRGPRRGGWSERGTDVTQAWPPSYRRSSSRERGRPQTIPCAPHPPGHAHLLPGPQLLALRPPRPRPGATWPARCPRAGPSCPTGEAGPARLGHPGHACTRESGSRWRRGLGCSALPCPRAVPPRPPRPSRVRAPRRRSQKGARVLTRVGVLGGIGKGRRVCQPPGFSQPPLPLLPSTSSSTHPAEGPAWGWGRAGACSPQLCLRSRGRGLRGRGAGSGQARGSHAGPSAPGAPQQRPAGG